MRWFPVCVRATRNIQPRFLSHRVHLVRVFLLIPTARMMAALPGVHSPPPDETEKRNRRMRSGMSGIGSTSRSSGWSFIGSKVDDAIVACAPVEPGVICRVGFTVVGEARAVAEHEQGGRFVSDEPCSPFLAGEEVQPE